jgi:hypothetical protein
VRSSAAEYLTFVAASGTGGVEAVYADENVWLSQKMMAQLYDVEVPTINYHLKKETSSPRAATISLCASQNSFDALGIRSVSILISLPPEGRSRRP